jgi:hypothetical protein
MIAEEGMGIMIITSMSITIRVLACSGRCESNRCVNQDGKRWSRQAMATPSLGAELTNHGAECREVENL